MRRLLVLALGMFFLVGMSMSAAGLQGHHGQRAINGAGWGPNFIDQDGDGICDHLQTGVPGSRQAQGGAPCAWCGFGGGGGSLVDFAANLTGKDRAAVVGQLRAGATFEQILAANGKATADLVSAVVAQRKSVFDQAVAAGRLSMEQATERLEAVRTHVEQAVAAGWSRGQGAGGHCAWGGPGMRHGARWH